MMRVLIVDVIFRGSRLQNTLQIAEVLVQSGASVFVLHRSFMNKPEEYKRLEDLGVVLLGELDIDINFWFRRLTFTEVTRSINTVRSVTREQCIDKIILTGLNEWLPVLSITALFMPKLPIYGVDYAPHVWLRPQTGLLVYTKYILNRVLRSIIFTTLPRLRLWLFDERVSDNKLRRCSTSSAKRFAIMPDPPPAYCEDIDALHLGRMNDNRIRILAVGLQSQRKGIDTLVALIKRKKLPASINLHLAGRLDDYSERYREYLKYTKSPNFTWDEGYFDDPAMRNLFLSATYVILPYERSFLSPSGVLVSAANFCKPVIASNHGLIGYLVKKYKIGVTYDCDKLEELDNILYNLQDTNSSRYVEMSTNAKLFATTFSKARFREIIKNEILLK